MEEISHLVTGVIKLNPKELDNLNALRNSFRENQMKTDKNTNILQM